MSPLTRKSRRGHSSCGGFTLIELVVVIAIIAVLVNLTLMKTGFIMAKSRDVRRLADMHAFQTALELYKLNKGKYPNATTDSGCEGWETDIWDLAHGNSFIPALVTDGEMPTTPHDPKSGPGPSVAGTCMTQESYWYYRYESTVFNTPDLCNGGPFYVLGIVWMESLPANRTNHSTYWPTSPGWKDSEGNWQVNFDWVTGRCE